MKETVFFLFVFTLLIGCTTPKSKEVPEEEFRDLSHIKKDNELVALTLSGSTSYFIYKGEPMGYEYEMVKDFADFLGVELKIKVAENVTRLTEMLEAGEGDMIAYNIPVTNRMKEQLVYCGYESVNEQVLIQRAGRKDTLLKDVTDLVGKEVWVVQGSKYYDRLINLNEEIGGGIYIKSIEKDTVSIEDLIESVAKGTISYTFSDRDIARLNKTYYPDININLIVSHPQRSSWAVNKTSPELAGAVREWMRENYNKPRSGAIMKRYFEMSKRPPEESFPPLTDGQISPYDSLFRHYAQKAGWDWTLLASIAYQESKFNTSTVSWAGATGLMGLMPRTAANFGLTPEEMTDPEKSLQAGTDYIVHLHRFYKKVENEKEKIKFILASYNAGPGHILDAQALASKYGKDPHVWESHVEEFIKLKSLPEYYNDSICKLGYFRGTETLKYVEQVVGRWNYYREKVNEQIHKN